MKAAIYKREKKLCKIKICPDYFFVQEDLGEPIIWKMTRATIDIKKLTRQSEDFIVNILPTQERKCTTNP